MKLQKTQEMLTVVLNNKNNFENKLKSILDDAELRNETAITILASKDWFYKIHEFFMKHENIQKIKAGDNIFFVIKHMRIQLEPIHIYI